jgi:hypothetical protein
VLAAEYTDPPDYDRIEAGRGAHRSDLAGFRLAGGQEVQFGIRGGDRPDHGGVGTVSDRPGHVAFQ